MAHLGDFEGPQKRDGKSHRPKQVVEGFLQTLVFNNPQILNK